MTASRSVEPAPLAQNHQYIAELSAQHPGAGQHTMVVSVPQGRHGVEAEEAVLRRLAERHHALRLRVAEDHTTALTDPVASVSISSVPDIEVGREAARIFLESPIDLPSQTAWQFHIIEIGATGVSHLLAAKASHIALDAESRFVMLRERDALLDDSEPALRPAAQWTAYGAWEQDHAVAPNDRDMAILELPPWEAGARPETHDGMRLAPIRRAMPPDNTNLHGIRAMAWFTSVFTGAAVSCRLSERPVVALPMSFRRAVGDLRSVGDFVDHLVVAPASASERDPQRLATELRRQAAAPVPLRQRLVSLGASRWRDPSPLTQAVLSYQPSSRHAPPFLLNLPNEAGGIALSRGERFEPVFVPVTPLERQDVALICCTYRGELRWRVSVRDGLGLTHRIDELDDAVCGGVVRRGGRPIQ